MKKLGLYILAIPPLVILSLFAQPVNTEESYFDDCSSYSKNVYCLTNEERKKNNLKLLKYSDELEEVSKNKSEDMCKLNYFSHDYNNQKWTRFIDSSSVDYLRAGENLTKGYETPMSAMEALIDSPKHYENIIGDYTHIGIYTSMCNGKNYTTQTFAKLV